MDLPSNSVKKIRYFIIIEPRHEISNNVVCATSKASDQPQSDQSLCWSLEYSMTVKLLTELHLEFLSLKGGCKARLSLHLSKRHIVGNHMSWLIFNYVQYILHKHFQVCRNPFMTYFQFDFQQCGMCDQQSLRSACAYTQSDQSLC